VSCVPEMPSRAYPGAYLGTARARAKIVASDGDSECVSLLNRPWALRDVQDVEAFARRILDTKLERRGSSLRPDLYDDAIAFLLEVAVRADRAYDPSRASSHSRTPWRVTPSRSSRLSGRGRYGRVEVVAAPVP
jgi:hypothetical protein